MLSVDQARAIILAAMAPPPAVRVPLAEALDLVLAEEIRAESDVPPFTNSAMDGFAVRAADTVGATPDAPVVLRVVGEVAAGMAPETRLVTGTAIRIMTGGPLPVGADAVARFEVTTEATGEEPTLSDVVGVIRSIPMGRDVRLAGEDIQAGVVVLKPGTRLRPAEIGVLASLNRAAVQVHPRPRVAILSTGNEVVDVDRPLEPGQIRDSNGYLLAAMVERWGGVPVRLGIAADSAPALWKSLDAATDVDLIVTSGGVSVGDYDIVKRALGQTGDVAVWQVRMRPGKPLAFGRVGGVPLLGLPGNPLAAAVAFEIFGRPALMTLFGRTPLDPPLVDAILLERVENPGGRRRFVPALFARDQQGSATVRPVGRGGSGILTSLLLANGLLIVGEQVAVAEPGLRFPVRLIDCDTGDVA